MTGLDRAAAADALAGAYGKITQFAGALTEADAMLPSRCAGWTVLDVLYHQLLDARRARRPSWSVNWCRRTRSKCVCTGT